MPDGAVTRLMEKSGSADEQERQLTKPERDGKDAGGDVKRHGQDGDMDFSTSPRPCREEKRKNVSP